MRIRFWIGKGMDRKQKIAIVALPVLTIMMIDVYKAAKYLLGAELAWYTGFWVYWPPHYS